MDGIKKMEGKKVYVELKNSRRYSGTLLSVDDEKSPVQFVNIIDKFDKPVCFAIGEIKLIQVEE